MKSRAMLLALWPLAGWAQTDAPPTIQLPLPPAAEVPAPRPAPGPAPTPQPAPQPTPQPATPAEAPPITLAPAPASPAVMPPAALVERDRATAAGQPAGVAAPDAGQFLPLTPARADLPRDVRVGASLTGAGILRLTGETAATELVLVLPENETPPQDLVLSLRSSVHVLPETAGLVVSVNGGEGIRLPLANPGAFAAVTFPAPGLRPGENRIALQATQPHRIFCGPDATFGVWTEVDLPNSGALVPPGTLGADAAGFATALRAQSAVGRPLALLVEEGVDPVLLRRVAMALGGIRIETQSFYRLGSDGYAAVALVASDRARVTYRQGASGAVVMVVEHVGPTLPDLPPLPPASLADAPLLTPGAPVTFRALGVDDFVGNTHYFSRDIAFRLPDDWLLLANQKARIDLRYGFADNLARGALMLVKVNGETVRLLPLDRNGGELQAPLDIGFAANLLRPGANSVSMEMIVPGAPPGSPCTARRADMLVVLGDSALDIPAAPRMREPGLATALAGLGGDGISVPDGQPGKTALDRALVSLAAMLGPGGTSRMQVVGVEGVPQIPLEQTGLSVRQVQDAMLGRPAAATAAATPAPPPRTPGFRLTDTDAPPATTIPAAPGFLDSLADRIGHALSADGWVARQAGAVAAAAWRGADGPLPEWLAGRNGQALLLRPDPAAPGDLWLVVAPGARLTDVAAALVSLRQAGQARGEAALLQADGQWAIWSPGRAPILEEPLTPANFRAVAGNYASWSPLLFSIATILLALLSVLPALLFIILTRRKGGQG